MPNSKMPEFTWQQLEEITGGRWRRKPDAGCGAKVCGVCDDSRSVAAGMLFLAIRGANVDGHDFLEKAIEQSAAAVCVETGRLSDTRLKAFNKHPVPILEVPDTLAAYHALANAWRCSCRQTTVVGITGSSGKTSLRAILESIARVAFGDDKVLATEENTNNEFGVPRNLLRLTPGHKVAIIELGTNHPGEIARLAAMTQPDVGVITAIGRGHLEFFGSVDDVAREKADLLRALPPTGIAVIPDACPGIDVLQAAAGNRRTLRFGSTAEADFSVLYHGRRQGSTDYELTIKSKLVNFPEVVAWPVGGQYQARNAAAAVAVARLLEIDPENIIEGLKKATLPGMRMRIERKYGCNWINDAYNANPDSMQAAVEWLAELTENEDNPNNNVWLVLGDMLELGTAAPEEHEKLLLFAREKLPCAEIVAVGQQMSAVARKLKLTGYKNVADAAKTILAQLTPGDWILLKGSRAMKLERLLE
ncbi:MAG: UDP-N-acetylmuramoyl-tripeptide--D-alanyl-D-alanine ligase [Lentisphaeria bacterium]